jgi:hypothetical protein
MPRAFAGARAKILANGKEIGWAQGVNGQENIALQRVDVLGDIDTQEIEAIGRTVSFSCDFVRILDQSLAEMGIWPRGGTEIVINFPELTFQIYDHVDEKVRWQIDGAKCESRSWRVDRTGVMTTNATWQARKLYDEAGVV